MTEPTKQPIFFVTNHHVADCGAAPTLPADFDTGPYFRSYFQNKYGEQWLFWRHLESGEYELRGGDCGWDNKLKPVLVDYETLITAMKKTKMANLAAQFVLAGASLTFNTREHHPRAVLVVNAVDEFITLNMGERLWIHACLIATRQEEVTPVEELVRLLQHFVKRTKALKSKMRSDG